MGLSSELISQFVKATKPAKPNNTETTVLGTIVCDGGTFVKLDGSDIMTPVALTTDVSDGDRVTVLIKNHTATVTGNISSPAAKNSSVEDVRDQLAEFEVIYAGLVTAEEFETEKARIDELVAEDARITNRLTTDEAIIEDLEADNVEIKESLTARDAAIEELQTGKLDSDTAAITYAKIESLDATNANVNSLQATYADFAQATADRLTAAEAVIDDLDATYASVEELDVVKGRVTDLEASVGDIDALMFGSATGDTIQTSFANSVVAQLGDAQIKSAMIESVSADKITAGDVITNNVRVKSEDGSLIISDETMQISDGTRVRVQIGKDSSNDYSINIWDQNGDLMFSKGGITDSAIKEAIIRNDMVSDTANIAAHKLDIDSLFEEINSDTSNTIKSTKVYLDDEGQTLDVAFETLTTDVSDLGETVSSQGTQISAIQGQISSKIWQQDIDTATGEMSTQYSALEQDLDGISATVASHGSQIATKADTSEVTSVSNRVTTVEANLSGFQSTVSSTYATKNEVDSLKIGGRNLFSGYDASEIQLSDYQDTGSFDQFVDCLTFNPCETVGETYTISFWAKSPNGSTPLSIYNQNSHPRHFYFPRTVLTSSLGDEWEYFTHTFVNVDMGDEYTDDYCNRIEFYASAQTGVLIKKIKVENGNRATDWTPAPEDMASESDIASAQISISETAERVSVAESLIQQLSDSIMTLVVDGNGASLMTQTDEGWTFNTAEIQTAINAASENLDSLNNEMGSVSSTVNVLEQAVVDLGTIAEYVTIGTYEDEPCIELGEADSDFKLIITNTRIMFMEGSGVPAYINNQSLYIKKAVIEEELQQGEFVWKARSNGNLGLVWKGVTS